MHEFDRIGTEICDEKITLAVYRNAVGQCGSAKNERRGIIGIDPPMTGLRYELLHAVRSNAHHAAARIGAPQGPVPFRQDAFGTLQALSDGLDGGAVHRPAGERIG
jgi:hypothetical protein